MQNQYKALILIIVFSFMNVSFAVESSFDEVCKIYTEVKNSNMSSEIASTYIFDNIKNRIISINALQTHEAIVSALGKERYNLFKESAEYYLKQKWECQAMKELMGQ